MELEERISQLEMLDAVRDERDRQMLAVMKEIKETLTAKEGYSVRIDRLERFSNTVTEVMRYVILPVLITETISFIGLVVSLLTHRASITFH